MLVLKRGISEEICIGDDIRIVVVDIRGDSVKIGIQAPRSVPVHRLEVQKRIAQKIEEQKAVDRDGQSD